MATQKDWKGFYNVVKEVDFNEDDFAYKVLLPFIHSKYPKVDITILLMTNNGLIVQDALLELFEQVTELSYQTLRICK